MQEERKFDILDVLVNIVKWKKQLIIQFITIFVLSYLAIFFFVDEQWDSSALIIPSEQNSLGGLGSLLGGFSDLPIDIGNFQSNPTISMYETILYSRTTADTMLKRFDLAEEYGESTFEENMKAYFDKFSTEETDQGSYIIKMRGSSPEKAADMVNFLLTFLNQKIIDLNIQKSHQNRLFLEKRYDEIHERLFSAEDSLAKFQENTKIYLAEDQIKATIGAYSSLEAELAKSEIENSINKKLLGENDIITKNSILMVEQLRRKLNSFKSKNENEILLNLDSLPSGAKEYARLFRNVKIYNAMLEFVTPLLEQARFEEQKDVPILQVIDYGIAPEKRAYPKRVITAIAITIIIELLLLFYMYFMQRIKSTTNSKLIFIKENLFKF